MQEEFLHFIWKTRRFAQHDLRTTDGQRLRILQPGRANHHAGPDFLDARIELDGTCWAGQVEMHRRASDWLRHGHQDDRAYDPVVLHVVLEADLPIRRRDGSLLPCLALRPYLPPRLVGRYQLLRQQAGWIPCQAQWPDPDPVVLNAWLDRLLVERLEARCVRLQALLDRYRGDWEQVFYQQLARGFGARVNADPFEQLAERTPLRLLRKHRDSRLRLEALLFGQAGLLPAESDHAYPRQLRREYEHLRRLYRLEPLPGHIWKFHRMRPNNFPSVRIAQFAALHHQTHALLDKALAARGREEIEHMFAVRLANYCKDHVRFDRPATRRPKRLGQAAVRGITVNAIAPVLFFYGRAQARPELEQRAIDLLDDLPPENNRITRAWRSLGLPLASAGQSQAALLWKASYCDQRRCLECAVGQQLLR